MNSGKLKKTNENDNDDNNKVNKITDALAVVMDRINALEKSIRPP